MGDKKIEPMSKDSTIDQPFTPSAGMKVWLDAAIQSDTDNITEIAQSCGMDRKNWYVWLDKPGFIEWWEAEWNRKLLGQGWRLDQIGMKNAKRDHRYWESMQKRMGRLQDKQPLVAIGAKADVMNVEFIVDE